MNRNFTRNHTKVKLNFLSLSLFNHYLASLLIARWPDQGPRTQNLLRNIIYKCGSKIQPVNRLFFDCKSKERSLLAMYTKN